MLFPAHCKNCNTAFAIDLPYVIGPGGRLRMQGNVTPCPNCNNQDATIADGVFLGDDNGLVGFLRGLPPEAFQAFKILLELARQRDMPAREIERRAAEISPDLGKIVRATRKAKGWRGAVLAGILLLAVQRCSTEFKHSQNLDVSLNVNQLVEQILRPEKPSAKDDAASPPSAEPEASKVQKKKAEKVTNRSKQQKLKANRRRQLNPKR